MKNNNENEELNEIEEEIYDDIEIITGDEEIYSDDAELLTEDEEEEIVGGEMVAETTGAIGLKRGQTYVIKPGVGISTANDKYKITTFGVGKGLSYQKQAVQLWGEYLIIKNASLQKNRVASVTVNFRGIYNGFTKKITRKFIGK